MKSFGQRLDALRKPGETKKDFAGRIGISPVQLSRYYSVTPPGRAVLERICQHTGTSLDWLLHGLESSEETSRARRLGAKADRSLTDRDRVELACSYIDDLRGIDRESRESLKEIIYEAIDNPDYLERIIKYLGFLKFEKTRSENRRPS